MKKKIIYMLLCISLNMFAQRQEYVETVNGLNMQFRYVSGGSFMMGCTEEQKPYCENDEQNVRKITLDGYYIGIFEVTQEQWQCIMGSSLKEQYDKEMKQSEINHVVNTVADFLDDLFSINSSDNNRDYLGEITGSANPMIYIDWFDANAFCVKLSELTGKHFDLPTEAQWEYAARGGNDGIQTIYSGSTQLDETGWYKDNSDDSLHAVGQLQPNQLGLSDMSGNVKEWCKDNYCEEYDLKQNNNPVEYRREGGDTRVLRGGCRYDVKSDCRVSKRDNAAATTKNDKIGFRVVLILEE